MAVSNAEALKSISEISRLAEFILTVEAPSQYKSNEFYDRSRSRSKLDDVCRSAPQDVSGNEHLARRLANRRQYVLRL